VALNDPSGPLQAAIVALLKACGSPAGERVYDRVPTNAQFPYIVFGNVQVISELIENFSGAEVYVTIDAWSREPGKTELQKIGNAIVDALDDALDDADLSDDVTVKSCLFNDVLYVPDPDGLTTHGIFTFHILTD
jgi:hypothetical protein